ncbi:hypothetical protein Tco_0109529 [Tanacetum coccineum]
MQISMKLLNVLWLVTTWMNLLLKRLSLKRDVVTIKIPPQPPPKKSDQSKNKKHDTDASASRPYHPQTSSAWKTTNTKDPPSSSSKQQQTLQSEQPIDDVPTFNVVHISDSKDENALSNPKKIAAETSCFGRLYMDLFIKCSAKVREEKLSKSNLEVQHSRSDYKEYKISEADFKNLHLNDFEDLYLFHLLRKLSTTSMDLTKIIYTMQ